MRYMNGLVVAVTVGAIFYGAALLGENGMAPPVAAAPAVEQTAAKPIEKDAAQQQAENATAAAALTPNEQMLAFVIGTRHMCNDVTKVLPTDKPKVYRVTCHSVEGAIATHDFLYDEPGDKITPLENNG
jgi:hypothetical protein